MDLSVQALFMFKCEKKLKALVRGFKSLYLHQSLVVTGNKINGILNE